MAELALLREAVEGLDLGCDPETLRAVLALRDQLDAKIAAALAEFDDRRLFEIDSATSTTAWLRNQGLDGRAAGSEANRARRLRHLPATAEAFEAGELRSGHVAAILANTKGRLIEQFAEREHDWVPQLAEFSPGDAAVAMQAWRAAAEDADDSRELPDETGEASWSITANGKGVLNATFNAADAEIVDTALRQFASQDVDGEQPRNAKQRRADIVVDLFKFALDHNGENKKTGRDRPHINVLLDATSGEMRTIDGRPMTGPGADSWLCDSLVYRLLMDADGAVLNYGRKVRTAPEELWNAIVARDGGCRFPGCDRKPSWCDAHHIVWWTHGGLTNIDQLALLCRRHHRKLHKQGWHAKLLPDATLEVVDPRGVVRASRPRGTDPPRLL